jgi:threonine dehydrogenase-like Zn-dependent dehydrogenase
MLQGDCPHPSQQHLTFDVLTRQLRVLGTHNENLPPKLARWTAAKQAALYLRYVQRGQMQTADLITHRYKPEDAPDVYASLDADRGNSAGVLFDWQ